MSPVVAWVSGAALIWSWFAYPTLAHVLAAVRGGKRAPGDGHSRSVSVILPVHNAGAVLRARLEELGWLADRRDDVEVIVALDGCTDDSAAAVAEAATRGLPIRALEVSQRRGKSNAQNEAVQAATGDILVLNDVGSRFEEAAFDALLAPFGDPDVGYVAGDLRWRAPDSAHQAAGGLYTRLERSLWGAEAALGVLHVAAGAFMAVRRPLWEPVDDDVGDDSAVPLSVLGQGRRGAFASDALAVDDFSPDLRRELKARIRMTSRSLRGTLRGMSRGRLWLRPGVVCAVVSHRLLRWTTPFWGLLLLVGVGARLPNWIAALVTALAALPAGLLAAGAVAGVLALSSRPGRRLLGFLVAFSIVNVGFALGVLHWVRGGRIGAYSTGREG